MFKMKTLCLDEVAMTVTIAKQTLYFNIQVSESMWQLHKGYEVVLKFPIALRLYFVTIRLNLFTAMSLLLLFCHCGAITKTSQITFLKHICKSYILMAKDFGKHNKTLNLFLALLPHDNQNSVFTDTDLKAILLKIVLLFWQKTYVIKGTPTGDNPFKSICNLYNLSLLGITK